MSNTKPSADQQPTAPDPTNESSPRSSSSFRSRIFTTMTRRPKVSFSRRRQPPSPPSPEVWSFVTHEYHGKHNNSLRGNLPGSMSGAEAKRKLEWIDNALQPVEVEEQAADWAARWRPDPGADGAAVEGDDGKWSKRVFWDRRRAEIWSMAGAAEGGKRADS